MQKVFSIIFILFLSPFIGFNVSAQHLIHGVVQDSLGIPIKSVNVRAILGNDSLVTSTNNNGEYKFENNGSQVVLLSFNMLGYSSKNLIEQLSSSESFHLMPTVRLSKYVRLLPSVDVVHVLPMVVNGDTTQFNFKAFDFRKNALLEEALKELPGFQVYRDGSVTYNGKIIRKVRVDNKDFFGGDLLTATRNLPAEFIKNIQLLNANTVKDDNTGLLNDDDEKVLNITLKEDKKKILFGQTTLGAGSNERYIGSFGINKFNQGQELSVLGSFNNTNTNLFSFGIPGGGERSKSIMDMEGFSDPIDGLNKIGSLGVTVSDQVAKNIYMTAGYNYLYQSNITEGNSLVTSTYTNNIIQRKEDYVINTTNKNHKFRIGLDIKFNNNDIFKVNGNFIYNQQEMWQTKDLLLSNLRSMSEGVYRDSSEAISPNGEIDLFYSKFFKKKGRKLLASLNINSYNINKNDFVNEEYLEYKLSNESYLNKNRQSHFINLSNHTNSNRLKLTFVEPFFEHSLFEFNYEFEGTSTKSLRLVEDRLLDDTNRFIDSLTVDYDYMYNSHRVGMIYQYQPSNKLKMNIGFTVQPLFMEGYLPSDRIQYNYDNVNLMPTANFLYKFSKESDIQMSYKGKSNQPYFNQIAPVVDNTNSKNIVIGNPELKAEYAHRLISTYRKSVGHKMQFFETSLAYSFVFDKIVSEKKTLMQSNIQETTFKNTSGYYDWKWYYSFSTPIFLEELQLDLTGSSDYYNNLSFIDNRKRTTKQLILNQTLQFKYNYDDYFETSLQANYSYNQVRFDIPSRTKINIETLLLGLGSKGYITNYLALGLEMSQRFNDGYKNKILNVNQTMMNSFIEYTFLRNRSALLRFQAYDLLDQNKNSGIISEYIGNDVYEARNNRLGRYFMLSLNIRLQKFPK